jgi:alpha-tubulin suppressor-like RCC1 family protein
MPKKAILIYSGGDFAACILEDRSMVTWGFGHSGELGQSADMVIPNPKGEYNLMPSAMGYNKVDAAGRKVVDQHILMEKFMTPKPPRFNWGSRKKVVLTVGCGLYHMLVVAREPSAL